MVAVQALEERTAEQRDAITKLEARLEALEAQISATEGLAEE